MHTILWLFLNLYISCSRVHGPITFMLLKYMYQCTESFHVWYCTFSSQLHQVQIKMFIVLYVKVKWGTSQTKPRSSATNIDTIYCNLHKNQSLTLYITQFVVNHQTPGGILSTPSVRGFRTSEPGRIAQSPPHFEYLFLHILHTWNCVRSTNLPVTFCSKITWSNGGCFRCIHVKGISYTLKVSKTGMILTNYILNRRQWLDEHRMKTI
jgi:hypothetical protein